MLFSKKPGENCMFLQFLSKNHFWPLNVFIRVGFIVEDIKDNFKLIITLTFLNQIFWRNLSSSSVDGSKIVTD